MQDKGKNSSNVSDTKSFEFEQGGDRASITVRGRLDVDTAGQLWPGVMGAVDKLEADKLVVQAGEVEYCDTAGAALLLEVEKRAKEQDADFEIEGLKSEFGELLEIVRPNFEAKPFEEEKSRPCYSFTCEVGHATVSILKGFYSNISFLGEIFASLVYGLLHPRKIRWKDVFVVVESTGVNAVPIISLIGFLMGLILGFQGAIMLSRWGTEVFVADFVAMSIVRVLGPFMTAIVLAGRSGSAFAAELGTMKVNEEIDALTTLGLEPVRFLGITRVLAAVIVTPLLTIFAHFASLISTALVMRSIGYTFVTTVNRIQEAVPVDDYLAGLFKAAVFGFIIATVGCLRGFQTKAGARSVGQSATQAVVSCIVWIVVAEGMFAVLFYYLGI